MMNKHLALGCFCLLAVSSQASVAFNTFGPADATGASGWGFGDIKDTRIATQFSPYISGTLKSVKMKLQRSSASAIATISVFEDSGNDIGAVMTRFYTRVSAGGIVTFTNTNPLITLAKGKKYWIEVKTTVAGSGLYSGWVLNNRGLRGFIKFGKVIGTATERPTYRVGLGTLPAYTVEVNR